MAKEGFLKFWIYLSKLHENVARCKVFKSETVKLVKSFTFIVVTTVMNIMRSRHTVNYCNYTTFKLVPWKSFYTAVTTRSLLLRRLLLCNDIIPVVICYFSICFNHKCTSTINRFHHVEYPISTKSRRSDPLYHSKRKHDGIGLLRHLHCEWCGEIHSYS